MNRQRVKELLPIMQAYAEGKTIQYKSFNGIWIDLETPSFNDTYEYRIKPSEKYTEIFKLKKMLEDAHIPFEWIEHGGDKQGYQICYPKEGEERICSVIEHEYSYGNEKDLLEILGLLTLEEEKNNSVVGYLTADNVFSRISEHWEKVNTPLYRPFLDSAELILEWDKKLGDISVLGRPIEPCSLQEPFIWVKHKVDDRRRLIVGFGENFVELGNKSKPVTMQRLFEMYEFLDGTPCGVKNDSN